MNGRTQEGRSEGLASPAFVATCASFRGLPRHQVPGSRRLHQNHSVVVVEAGGPDAGVCKARLHPSEGARERSFLAASSLAPCGPWHSSPCGPNLCLCLHMALASVPLRVLPSCATSGRAATRTPSQERGFCPCSCLRRPLLPPTGRKAPLPAGQRR